MSSVKYKKSHVNRISIVKLTLQYVRDPVGEDLVGEELKKWLSFKGHHMKS